MFGFQSLVFALFLASWAAAAPFHVTMPPYSWKAELCKLSPIIQKALCPRQSSGTTNSVTTPIGTAHGTLDDSGATRFAVKYASASRWQPSTLVTTWELPYAQPFLVLCSIAKLTRIVWQEWFFQRHGPPRAMRADGQ